MSDKIDPGEGYRLLEDGEIKPDGYEVFDFKVRSWVVGTAVGDDVRKGMSPCRAKIAKIPAKRSVKPSEEATVADRVDAKIQELKGAIEANLTPDPKTKYLRDIYPVDSEVHEDAQGRKYVKVDVYSVLRAFGVDHPTGHAVKKLLCAGMRGKGDRIQDLTEAKVAIDRAIQEAGI